MENKRVMWKALKYYGLRCPTWRSELEVLYPSVSNLLPKLHSAHKIGILANQLRSTVRRLGRFGIDSWIDLSGFLPMLAWQKPDFAILS